MPFAAVAGAAVSAGAGLIASGMQSSAVSGAADKANAAQKAALDQSRADLEPWRTTGSNALGVAGNLSGANGVDAASGAMGDFFTSPGYQWRLDEGMRGVDAGAAAKGILRSGATLKAEQKYAQGLASSEFDNYYNRLFDLSKLGENAAATSGDQSVKTGQGIAQTDISAGGAQASIYGNAAKGISSAANSLGSLYGNGSSNNWDMVPSGGFNPSGNTWYS